jgi:hypothetical protein
MLQVRITADALTAEQGIKLALKTKIVRMDGGNSHKESPKRFM